MTPSESRQALIAAVARGLRARNVAFLHCTCCGWPTRNLALAVCGVCLETYAMPREESPRPRLVEPADPRHHVTPARRRTIG